MTEVVGVISAPTLRRKSCKTHLEENLLLPVLESQVDQQCWALLVRGNQVAAGFALGNKPNSPQIKKLILSLVSNKGELGKILEKSFFLVNKSCYSFHCPKTGQAFHAEIVPAMDSRSKATIFSLWNTIVELEHTTQEEFWLTPTSMDVSLFLRLLIAEKKCITPEQPLHYQTKMWKTPSDHLLQGVAQHANISITFGKNVRASS